MESERVDKRARPVRIPPKPASAAQAAGGANSPDGTAEATKQNIEAQPHPSKRIDPAASRANQAAPAGASSPGPRR